MDWCGSSTPRTPEDRIMNEERHERKAYWLVIVRPQFLTGGDTKGLCPSIPWSCRNKVQVYRSVRMPQLHTSLHFHLTPIVMINGSSRRDLLLNSQKKLLSLHPRRGREPVAVSAVLPELWGSRNRRALILGWAYYLDAFSSYPLRTWLPSVYRGHDNWYTRGPDSPSVDEPCGGTLRFSGHWILTNVCVTQADILASASFGRSLSPVHLRRKSARSVSYYALFQGWLLLGKPPGCLCTPTSFLALSGHLGALAGDPGCFPLDDGAYPPSSHWPTLTPVILGSYLVFRVCLDLVLHFLFPLRPNLNLCSRDSCPYTDKGCMDSREERSRGGPSRTARIPRVIESWIYIGSHPNRPIYPPEEEFGFKPRFEQEEYAMLIRSSLLFLGCEAVSNQNTQQALALPEKEVIQPHLPVRLPCYDFTPVTSPAFGIPLLAVKVTTSGMASSHSVTGGELQPAIRTEDGFLGLAHPRGIATLCPGHCSTTTGVSNPIRSPSFRLSVSVSAQQSAFAVGVLSDLYAFHRSTGNSLCPYHALRPIIPDNACILCITAAAGTELADAYSPDTVIASSPGKEVHDPWAFYLHAALLRQAFAHCGKFPTAASRRSLGRVSVPVWLIILSDQLLIIALRGANPTRKTHIGLRDNQARTDDFHHVKVTLYR
nr:hypothetical protein DCAR_001525 [Ipomoea trifida]